jgi:uncharacterized protein (DUF342 family)
MVATLVQDNLTYTISNIQEEIKLQYKFKISYYKTWAAKLKILDELFETHKDSFKMLSRLFMALQESNSEI